MQDEAFALWTQHWSSIYPEGSNSRRIIEEDIHDSYCLVNLVDNDFVRGNCLFELIRKTVEKREKIENSVDDQNVLDCDYHTSQSGPLDKIEEREARFTNPGYAGVHANETKVSAGI